MMASPVQDASLGMFRMKSGCGCAARGASRSARVTGLAEIMPTIAGGKSFRSTSTNPRPIRSARETEVCWGRTPTSHFDWSLGIGQHHPVHGRRIGTAAGDPLEMTGDQVVGVLPELFECRDLP